jgi:signal transduction histidine kinase
MNIRGSNEIQKYLIIRYQNLTYDNKDRHMLTIRDISKLRDLEKAESKNAYMNALNATVTHELITPLICILTFANGILKAVSDPFVQSQTKMILSSAKLMRLLVSDLLDRSKAELGKLTFSKSKANITQLTREVFSLMRPQGQYKGVEIIEENFLPPN